MDVNFLQYDANFLLVWLWNVFLFQDGLKDGLILVQRDTLFHPFNNRDWPFNRNVLFDGRINWIVYFDWSFIWNGNFLDYRFRFYSVAQTGPS